MSEFDDPVDEDPPEEYRSPRCLICGCEFEWVDCWNGCDEGFFDGYDEDPLWYDPGDLIGCSVCGGRGGYLACPNAENHKSIMARAEIARRKNRPKIGSRKATR